MDGVVSRLGKTDTRFWVIMDGDEDNGRNSQTMSHPLSGVVGACAGVEV